MKTFFILLVSFFLFSSSIRGQVIYNINLKAEVGFPDPQITWSANIPNGPFGGPIVVGNTVSENEAANIFTTVLDNYGGIVWEQQWNAPDSSNDYGSSVALFGDTLIVGGATFNLLQQAYDFVILAYDVTDGSLLWSTVHNGTGNNHDGVTGLAIDSLGGIYATGASVGIGSLSDYLTMKLHMGTGAILWQQRYDYNSLHDAPVKIIEASGSVVVVGASANMINDWDYCTVEYDHAGNQTAVRRSGSGTYYFDQPTDMVKDATGNVYVCGRVKNTNGDEDIKLLKMDSDLNILWQETIDVAGTDDGANAVAVDILGNVFITGYYTTEGNNKGFVAYKFDSSGDVIWSKKFAAPWGGNFEGMDVATWYGISVYTGYLRGENGTDDLVLYVLDDYGKQVLFTTFDLLNAGIAFEKGTTIDYINETNLAIGATVTNPSLGTTRYLTLRYDYKLRDMEPEVIDSIPAYHKTEMIARFRTDVLNYDFIDNKNMRFAKLEDVIDEVAIALMDSVLDNRCKDWTVSKIFPYLTSANQTMLNAHGIEVQLPQFYTWLTLSIPKDETIEEVIPLLDELGSVFVDVSFNECVVPFSVPNDEWYGAKQKSLHLVVDPNTTPIYPPHIDIEPAWEYSVGSRANIDGGTNTTVGVFDSGINENHEDLNILEGYDYYYDNGNSTVLNPENDQANDSHGTAMAGIIAAKRNNEIGVAGIAGGDWENYKPGVNIVNYKILSDAGTVPSNHEIYYGYMNTVFQAMIDASAIGSHPKLDIYNCSWGVNEPVNVPGLPAELSCWDECAIILTTLARQGSVLVAGSGNNGDIDVPKFPASTRPPNQTGDIEFTGSPDEFVICVGGSTSDGLGSLYTSKGYFVDLIAPSYSELIYTTINGDTTSYGHIGATSPAAAHVSGVCALLHDYLTYSDDAVNAVSVPVAEDYEKIITNSAFDIVEHPSFPSQTGIYSQGWDLWSANGLLNARAALEYVDLNYNKIWHFNSDNAGFDIDYVGEMNLNFTKEYNTVPGMEGWNSGQYACDVYQVNAHTTHTFLFGETMLDYWPLHSQSNTYHFVYEGEPFSRIMQFPKVQIMACSETGAYLRGYTFFIKHPVGQEGVSVNEWYPVDTLNAYMAYSVYTSTATSVNPPKPKEDWSFSLYPNPASDQLFLKLPNLNSSYLEVSIHDLSGKLVQSERNTFNSAGNVIKVVNISALASGVYLCSIKSDNKISTLKFIKQ